MDHGEDCRAAGILVSGGWDQAMETLPPEGLSDERVGGVTDLKLSPTHSQ